MKLNTGPFRILYPRSHISLEKFQEITEHKIVPS